MRGGGGGGGGGVYCARNVAVEMFCERCEEERDFAASGNGV